ncbi:reverse transcriptase domain-containing protein [Tanacetum coccineum]
MRISRFMHGITYPELIKRLLDKIPRSVDEMMRVTTSFLGREVIAVGHNIDECMHLKRQIEELLKNGKLSHVIKELKQNNGKDQPKTNKKGETSHKHKALAILMVQPWQRVARQRITQSFSHDPEISFPPLEEEEGIKGPMIIDAEIRGHFIHRMYVDGGSASEILVQWRNHMAVGKDITAGEDWRRGTFNLGLDEFCDRGMLTLKSSKIIPIECVAVSGLEGQPVADNQAIEERIKEGRNKLCDLLQRNLDVFAWKPADMTGVPRHIAEHRLHVREGCPSVRQKKRGQAVDKNQAIQEKVEKLVDVDAYKGYHQMKMAKEDEEKTTFITSQGIFCYSNMPFGLRNAGATYQRLVDKAFHKQIGKNLKVYVDDLVIKSRTEDEIIRDIEETFKTLREINMKLNPKNAPSGCCFKSSVFDMFEDVQKLNGKLASLNGFLAKSAEKSLPFFKTLKKYTKKSNFHWTEEAESAFKQMNQLIAKLPMLTAPEEKEELIVYLTAAKEAPRLERSRSELHINGLVHASKRLKRYFQAHPIIVVTNQPIKQVLSRPKVARRLQKWSIELGEYAIHYRPRVSVKGQILADFIVERPEEDSLDTPMDIEEELPEPWILFTDGSSCADGSGAGLILTNPEGTEFTYALRFRFEATNNEAEYEALIAGLRIAEQMDVKNLQANVDSGLVANQVNKTYIAKEADMIRYLEKVRALTNGFRMFSIKQVPRSKNKKADALSKIASTSFAHLSKQVLFEELKEKSINEMEVSAVVEKEGDTWMTLIYEYLTEETLPADVNKARAVRRKSQRFAVINGVIYTKSFLGPLLRCVRPLQANYVLREIQEGSCSMHACTRSVVAKALQTGYYWPTRCKDIDKGMPRLLGPGKVKFLVVAIDYFTKWIEANPVATITGNQVKKFMWDNIVCRFGLPGEIISNNGKKSEITHSKIGAKKRENRSLGEGIKARLDARSKNWMEAVSYVLWAHHTMIKSSNGDTPFSLTYGTEAVIAAKIGMPTLRTAEVDMVQNDEALEINLDLLEERRE